MRLCSRHPSCRGLFGFLGAGKFTVLSFRPSNMHLTSHLMILRQTLTRIHFLCVCTSSGQRQTPSAAVPMSILYGALMTYVRYHRFWHSWLSGVLFRGRSSSLATDVLYPASDWCKRCSGGVVSRSRLLKVYRPQLANPCRSYSQSPLHRRLYHQRVGTLEKQGIGGVYKVACQESCTLVETISLLAWVITAVCIKYIGCRKNTSSLA